MYEYKNAGYVYQYPRPAVTADCVVFGFDVSEASLKVLLVERGNDPYKEKLAFPGGFLEIQCKKNEDGLVVEEKNESLEQCALRELKEETGISLSKIHQVGAWSTPGRDPRCVTITNAFVGCMPVSMFAKAGDDAASVRWVSVHEILTAIEHMPEGMRFLAFDHDEILVAALRRVQQLICFEPVIFDLLPRQFSISSIQAAYEQLLIRKFDRRNFARKLLDSNVLDSEKISAKRVVYRFNQQKYNEFIEKGKLSNLIF